MYNTVIVLRFVHVLCGVYWAGTMLFAATFLEPSVRNSGPGGGAVMMALIRRGYFSVMPLVAGLALLSGAVLFWHNARDFGPTWTASRQGILFALGGLAALAAFAVGMFETRPQTLRAGRLAQLAVSRDGGADRDARETAMGAAQQRAARSLRWVAALLVLSVATMAVARYVM